MKINDLPEWKPIRSFTDQELSDLLEHNQEIDLHLLAGICSEILRREIRKGEDGS